MEGRWPVKVSAPLPLATYKQAAEQGGVDCCGLVALAQR